MRQIFVNLPVKDLEKSKRFFTSLGFAINPQFTDDNAACIVIEEGSIHAMLLKEDMFKTFIPNHAISDARKTKEVLVALSCASDQEIKELVAKASATGGKPAREPKDHGFMYEHAFEDPDGHIWELVHMREQPQ